MTTVKLQEMRRKNGVSYTVIMPKSIVEGKKYKKGTEFEVLIEGNDIIYRLVK